MFLIPTGKHGSYIMYMNMNLTVLSFALVITMLELKVEAQHVVMAPIAEKTVSGWQYGTMISFQAKSLWSIGGFYQRHFVGASDESPNGNPFYGIALNAPLVKSDKINFYYNTRAGLVDGRFIVVAPGLETELKLSRVVSFSVLMSVRMTYPSAAFKIHFKL